MKYPHLMARLFNVPLMVDPAKANVIMAGLSAKLGLAAPNLAIEGPGADAPQRQRMEIPGAHWSDCGYQVTRQGIAVVTIEGTTVHSAAGAYPPSGMTSYGEIRDQIEAAAVDNSVRAILLDVDSPGGEASDSAFALSERIRELRTAKLIWGVADEMACSAGYLVLSGCEKTYAPPLAYVGSIGVYALHLDMSAADKIEGLVWTYIQAGAHKTDGNEHEPISDDFRARVQSDVNATYARFLGQIGANRPALGSDGAKKTEANWYRGSESLALGLIDGVADFPTVLEALNAKLSGTSFTFRQVASAETATGDKSSSAAADHQENVMANEVNTDAAGVTKPGAQQQSSQQQAAAPDNVVDLNTVRQEAGRSATAIAAEIAELCNLAKKPELAAAFIASGKSMDVIRKELVAAQTAGTAEIAAHMPGLEIKQKARIDHRAIYDRFNGIKR